MNAEQLRALQAPLKERYENNPTAALVTSRATGRVSTEQLTCTVATGLGPAEAGLHPASGGDGKALCSGDMLLEALVGCAGVTLRVVATAMRIPLRSATITAEGDLDFRGTLGLSKEVPVGYQEIRLHFALDADAGPEQRDKLIQLTERYCVVYQTLQHAARLKTTHS
jgi:uncharacterized OsmC-like protein